MTQNDVIITWSKTNLTEYIQCFYIDCYINSHVSIELFEESIKSEHTKRCYRYYLKKYGKEKLSITDAKIVENQLINFILEQKQQGKKFYAIANYVNCIISFYKINDVLVNTRKITRFMPERRRVKSDRNYTHEEISKMLEIADERMRGVILILASSGMRIGALPFIKLRNLKENRLTVYETFGEEYQTFITPECRIAIDNYLDMRSRYGETLTEDSFLIREQFDIRDQFQIKKSRQISRDAIQWMIKDTVKRCGIGKDVMLAHGFRKFFTTQLVNSKVNPEIREMLLGHKIGLASSYYRPTEHEMLEEYQKAEDSLTIDPANRLRKKIETLTIEKSRLDRIEEKMLKMEQMYS
jgi:integrase